MENKEYKKITTDMRNKLREALPEQACKKHPSKSFLTAINPMFVIERLNDVFGVGSWQVKNEVILNDIDKNGSIVVKVSFSMPEYNIFLEQFGGNDNGGKDKKGFDLGDCFKGACTDGLTKIASYLEIGISIYKNQGNISSFIEYTEEEEKEQKRIIFLDKISKALADLTKDNLISLATYHEYIKNNLTDKKPHLLDDKDFVKIVDRFAPKPQVLENLAKQSVNKFDKCNTCSNETDFCICDIDKKAPVLAKV